MIAITLFVLCMLTACMLLNSSVVQAQEGETYSATLSGKDEVPPIGSNAIGWAKFLIPSDNGALVSYWINVTGLENITGVQIHNGSAGQNGDVVIALSNAESAKDKTKPVLRLKGNITKADLQGPLKGKEIADLVTLMIDGTAYANVQTDKYPDGAIRGQIASGEPQTNINMSSPAQSNNTR